MQPLNLDEESYSHLLTLINAEKEELLRNFYYLDSQLQLDSRYRVVSMIEDELQLSVQSLRTAIDQIDSILTQLSNDETPIDKPSWSRKEA